jgi:uncharacterized protein YgiM (DUF1202 family)
LDIRLEEKPLHSLNSCFRPLALRLPFRFALLLVLLFAASCKHGGPVGAGETMYVSAPLANLRDHVATVYNRVGTVKNGERVEVLERQRRFVRVRTAQKVEGWIELRALVPSETYDQFQKLSKDNRSTPVEGHGITRVELNMHVTPGRETDTLYQLAENSKVEMLKRSTAERATPEEIAARKAAALAKASGEQAKAAPKKSSKSAARQAQAQAAGKNAALNASQNTTQNAAQPATQKQNAGGSGATQSAAGQSGSQSAGQAANQSGNQGTGQSTPVEEPKAKPMDDWWLVRDQQGHVGWILARMVDLDIPMDVVQYAEGQRIQAAFVLNTVQDEEKGTISQYLVLLNANKDGIPYDFNQVRVFTWNLKRHRYETGYREHYIVGYLPVKVSTEDFGKEGTMPVFSIRKQNQDGSISERKYRVIGNIVRPVLAPGEQLPPAAHSPDEPTKNPEHEKKAAHSKSDVHRKAKH